MAAGRHLGPSAQQNSRRFGACFLIVKGGCGADAFAYGHKPIKNNFVYHMHAPT